VETDITFISVYRCPGCDVALEAVENPGVGWLRCPRCGRPSLPPSYTLSRHMQAAAGAANGHAAGLSGEELLLSVDEPPARPRSKLRILGVVLGIAIPVGISLAVGREPFETAMLGLVMAVAMVMLLRPGSRQ
jgi:hypothetical protein